jgi:hypothetical protein
MLEQVASNRHVLTYQRPVNKNQTELLQTTLHHLQTSHCTFFVHIAATCATHTNGTNDLVTYLDQNGTRTAIEFDGVSG